VDDAPFIREVLRHTFQNTEIEIVGEAGDGDEAIEVITRLRPQVVLMDIVMPKKSGIEATATLVKNIPDIKIIACSTIDQNSMIMKALEAGCCNYVTKPFSADDVINAVRSAVIGKTKEAGT
jgi:two-component system chemotaxis response regulator CheY